METSKPLEPETLNPLTSSPEDSPARISARPENEQALKDLAAAFGLSLHASLGSLDPDTCSLKTSQVCLFTTECEEFSENFPDAGMMLSGSVYELRSLERPTCESVFSLWPTAVANDDNKTPEGHLAMKQRMGERDGTGANRTAITSLAVKVQTWPTARAEDGESCGNHPGVTDSLTGATRNWPTPNAHDATGARGPGFELTDGHYKPHDLVKATDVWRTPDSAGEGGPRNRQNSIGDGHQVTIAEQAEHWKTPHGMSNVDFRGKVGGCGGGEFAKQANQWQTPATDSFRSRGGERKDEMGLDQQARAFPLIAEPTAYAITPTDHVTETTAGLPETDANTPKDSPTLMNLKTNWQTPQSMDWKSGEIKPETAAKHLGTRPLNEQVLSPQAPPIPDGLTSSENAQTSRRRLNPRFVEWLMGFPIGWTELCKTEPKDSRDSETQLSRKSRNGSDENC